MLPPDYVQRQARAQTTSASRSRLLLLVLEGGQAILVRARAALEAGEVAAFVADVGRAQDVLVALAEALDPAAGGVVAVNLARLSEFLIRHLAQATAERSLRHVDEVLRAYGPVIDAYRQIAGLGNPA